MGDKTKVYLTGFNEGRAEELLNRLARISGKPVEALSARLTSLPVLLVSGLSEQDAERLRHYLEEAGATMCLQSMAEISQPVKGMEPPEALPENRPHLPRASSPERMASISTSRPVPLGFWRRLKWTLRIAWRSFWNLILLNFIYLLFVSGSVFIASMFAGVDVGMLGKEANSLSGMAHLLNSPGVAVVMLANLIIVSLAATWLQAAFLQLPLRFMEKGGRPPVRTLISGAFHRMPDFLGATALSLLIAILIQMALLLPLVIFFSSASWFMPALAITMTLTIIVIIPILSLVPVVAANEPVSPWEALQRGIALSRGRRMSIIWNLLLLVVLVGLAMMAGQMLVGLMSAGLAWISPMAMFAVFPLEIILVVFAQIMMMMLFNGFLSFFYVEARVIGEAWKPAWAEAPHESWPLGDDAEFELLAERSWRGWRDMILTLLLTAGLLGLGSYLLGDQVSSLFQRMAALRQGGISQIGETGISVKGPAIQLKAKTFFGGDKPSFWIMTTLRGIPGFPSGLSSKGLVRILIDSIQSGDGRELYDAHSSFETKPFTSVRLNSAGTGELNGMRSVQVIAGTKEGDIATVRGRLRLRIPTGIGDVVLDRSGQHKTWNGDGITVENMQGNKASLTLESTSLKQKVIGFMAEFDDGQRHSPKRTSWQQHGGSWLYKLRFAKPIRHLHVYLSHGISTSERSFSLRWKQGVSLPVSGLGHDANRTITGMSSGQAYKLYNAGKYRQSIHLLDQIIRSEPDNAWALYTRGWAWWKLNKQVKARADMAQACKFNYLDSCNLRVN